MELKNELKGGETNTETEGEEMFRKKGTLIIDKDFEKKMEKTIKEILKSSKKKFKKW